MLRDPQMSEWGNPAEAIPSLHQKDVERTRKSPNRGCYGTARGCRTVDGMTDIG